MKLNLVTLFTTVMLLVSCGKQEETQTTTQQNQQMTQQQTQTQPRTQTQPTDEKVKEEEKKKDEIKKKEDEKKKEEKKKEDAVQKEDDKKTETRDESIKTTDPADIDFAPIFAKRCAKCHGKDLKGKEDGGPDLTRSETQSRSDKKLFDIISNGVKAESEEEEDMPAFKGKLTEDEINAAIRYIKNH